MAFTGTTAQDFIDFVSDLLIDPTTDNGMTVPNNQLNNLIRDAFSDEQDVFRHLTKEFLYGGTELQTLLFKKAQGDWDAEKQAELDAILTPENLHAVIKYANSNGSRPNIGGFSTPLRRNPEHNSRRKEIAEDVIYYEDYYSSLEAGETPSLLNVIYNNTAYEFGLDRFSDPAAREQHEATADLAEFRLKPKFREDLYSPLDFDQNGVVDALTDGLLYMRYLFGLTGESLAEDTVAEDATRTIEEIETYLGEVMDSKESNPALFNALDLDSDGTLDALTDGMMLLRYAFGLTGEPLLDSALAENSKFLEITDTAERALAVESKIESMMSKIGDNRIKVDENNNILVPPDGVTTKGGIDLYTDQARVRGVDVPEDYEHDYSLAEPSGEEGPTGPQEPELNTLDAALDWLEINENQFLGPNTFDPAYASLDDQSKALVDDIRSHPAYGGSVMFDFDNGRSVFEAQYNAPAIVDSDGDGVADEEDAFPNDASETVDTDSDGVGDNADVADDNPDIKTQVQLDEYNAEVAKQQALDNYTGDTTLPEGSGEEQIRKRFEYWRDNPPADAQDNMDRQFEAGDIATLNASAFAAVAADFNKDGGTSGVADLDFFDANPDVAGVTSQTEADAYAAEQAEILAKQQALDNYTGNTTLPEGSGEEQIRKRFKFFSDNSSMTAESDAARRAEVEQIQSSYPDAYATVAEDFNKDGGDAGVNDLDFFDRFPDDATETDDLDNDGVGDNADYAPNDPTVSDEAIDAREGVTKDTVGWSEDGTTFDNGLDLEGSEVVSYQRRSQPLTPEQLVATYYDILEGKSEITDPRGGEIVMNNMTIEEYRQVAGGSLAVAEKFLELYTQGEVLYRYQEEGTGRKVNINYGVDPDNEGEFITLKEMFELRAPVVEGVGRPDRDQLLPAAFVEGVHTMPTYEELSDLYMQMVGEYGVAGIETGYTFANAVFANLDPKILKIWQDGGTLQELYNDPYFVDHLRVALPPSTMVGVAGWESVDTDALREYANKDKRGDNLTAFGQEIKNIADAIDQYNEDPASLSGTQRHYIHNFVAMQPELLSAEEIVGAPEEELASTAALDAIADLYNLQRAQELWGQREDLYDTVPALVTSILDKKYEVDVEADYLLGRAASGGNFPLEFDGTGRVVGTLPGQDVYGRDIRGNVKGEEEGNLLSQYGRNFTRDVNEMGLPLYQETDIFGVPPGTQARFYELHEKENKNSAEQSEYEDLTATLSRGYEIDGDTLWFDATRVYMKQPIHAQEWIDLDQYVSEGLYDSNGPAAVDPVTGLRRGYAKQYVDGKHTQQQRVGSNFGIQNSMGGVADYSMFANPGEVNEGNGFWYDITEGEAPVGSYSMVWVAQPVYQPPQDLFEKILTNPFVNIIASLAFPTYGALVLGGLKAASGIELTPGDWLGMAIGGLKLSGKLQMPGTAAEANTAGEAAAGEFAKEADALAAAGTPLSALELATGLQTAYEASYATTLTGFGIAGLTATQTVNLMKVVAYEGDIGDVLLSSFGDEYFSEALQTVGLDTSAINPTVMEYATKTVTELLNNPDLSFEDAIKTAAGRDLLGYLETTVEASTAYNDAKRLVEGATADLRGAIEAVENLASTTVDEMKEIVEYVGSAVGEDVLENIQRITTGAKESFSDITTALGNVVDTMEKDDLQPIATSVKNNMSKFMVLAGEDKLDLFQASGDAESDVANLMENIKNSVGEMYDNVDDAVIDTIREDFVRRIGTGEGLSPQERDAMLTEGIVTIKAIDKLENNVVDAITPRILTTALQNTIIAGIGDGDVSLNEVFLQSIADSTTQSLTFAAQTEGWEGVKNAFQSFDDKISGRYRDVVEAANAYNSLDVEFQELQTEKITLEQQLEADEIEYARLEAIANAPDASQAEIDEFLAFAEQFTEAEPVMLDRIKGIEDDAKEIIDSIPVLEGTYVNALGELNSEIDRQDPKIQLQFDDILVNGLRTISGEQSYDEETDWFEYAQINNLAAIYGDDITIQEIAEHYFTIGVKEGLPLSIEEAESRRATALSSYVIGTINESGVDLDNINNSDRSKIINTVISETNKAMEDTGVTAVQYLEGKVNEFKNNPEQAAADAVTLVTNSLSADPNNPASIVQINEANNIRNAYISVDELYRQNGIDPSQMSNEMLGKVARGEVSYSIEYDEDTNLSKIVWGSDAPGTNGNWVQRAWDENKQRFVTYEYNSVSSTRVEIDADGNTVGSREEFTPVDTTIDYFAEKNPMAFMALLARADNETALHAENARIGADAYDRAPIFNIPPELWKDVNEVYLPTGTKMAQGSFKKWEENSTRLQGELAALNALTPNVPPEDMAAHLEDIEDVESELERQNLQIENVAQITRGLTGAASTINNTLITAKLGFDLYSVFNAGWRAVNGYDNVEEAMDDVDLSMSNEFTKTLDVLDFIATGYVPEFYTDDLNAIQDRWDKADGAIEAVQAVFGSFADYPLTFASEFIALELIEEVVPLLVGGIYGKAATKATIGAMGKNELKDLSPTLINNLFTDKAIKGALATDLTMAFGGAIDQTYDEAFNLAMGTGNYTEKEAQATAALLSVQAGTFAVSIIGMIPGANLALDRAILRGTTADAITNHAKRLSDEIGDFSAVVGKETVSEILEETGVVALNELGYYNMGYDGETLNTSGEVLAARDVSGNLGNAAAVSAIASAGTTSTILGIKNSYDSLGGDTTNPFSFTAATQNPEIAAAIEDAKATGNTANLTQVLTAVGIASMPLATDIYNMADDASYVTRLEAEQSFDRLGVEPTKDMLASAMTLDDTALDDDLAYTLATEYGMKESIGTGRTTAQHYDIIQHIQNMANGVVPLDSSFNQNGDNMVDQADVDTYIAKLPRYEREQYQNYDATAHQDTGIVQELGGSLMTIDELNTLKSNINTLMNRDVPPTKEEIVALLMNDPAITGLPGQIEAAVNNAFAKKENKEAFAEEVITQMINDETIKTISQDALKEVMGDPDGATEAKQGIFGVIEGLKAMLDLGESDAETLAEYISDAVGTAGTFKDGVYQDDGTGLLGELTAQGVLQDVAIAEIASILGSEEAGTGLYAIAKDASDTKAAVDRIESEYGTLDSDYTTLKTLYDTAITNMQTNLGSPDSNPDVPGNQPTGLYALVGQAITAGNNAKGEVEKILGDYADFAAFESALGITIDGKIDEIESLFGTPPVYQLNDDGTVKRDEDDVPLFEEGGEPTGYHLAMYNAMQLQGIDRDLAIATLQNDLNQKITDLQDFTTNATAEKIKTEILDVYFPAKPDNFETGRALAVEEDYVRGLAASGEYDASYDYNGDQEISVVEWRANRTPSQVEAQNAYNTWADNTTGITPALENLSIETGTNFALLNQRVDAVETGVTDYIRDNVLNVIGSPSDGVNDASGIFLAIEKGDDAVLEVLGSIGEDGSGVLRSLELLGLSTSEIQTFLDTNIGKPAVSADEATADNPQRPASGIFELFEQNTENYSSLVADYDKLAGDALTLAGEYQTLADSTANKITAIDTTIGTLPTDEDGDGVFEGGSGLRLELFNQGLSIDEVNDVLGSVDDENSIIGRLAAIKSTADKAATTSALNTVSGNLSTLSGVVGTAEDKSGLFGAIDSLATTTASNTEKYENLLSNYSDISDKYDTLAGEYQTLSDSTANKIAAIDTTIGTLPTDEDGDGVFEGGSGLRLELFNQGLSIDEVNNVLGSEDNTDSILGKLKLIKDTADGAATTSALSAVSGNLTTLAGVVGTKDDNSGLFGAIDSLATTTASNTEKYENLLSNYSDISDKYDTLAEETVGLAEDFETLAGSTADKITAIDTTIGTLPTDEDGDGVFEGGSGLRLELFNQGLSIDEVNNVLGSEDDTDSILGRLKLIKDTADGAATTGELNTVSGNLSTLAGVVGTKDDNSGLFGAIDSLASTTASNTEKYENLLSNYSDISDKYDALAEETVGLAEDFETLAGSTADKITAIDTTIGTLPTDEDGDGVFEGGSGLRLELFNQGLSIDEINATFGSVDDADSIIGRLAAIKSTADAAATTADLTLLDNEVGALTTTIGNAESGLVKTVNDLSEGAITKDNFGQALIDEGVLTTTNIGQALIDADVATGADVADAISGIEFPETDLSGVATTEQVEGVQDTVNQIADFMGIPANEVTQQDMDAFAVVIADFEMDAERVAQQDMLRYDVNADGIIDTTDQNILQAGLEGDYSGFAPDAQFNQATGMFLERQQDQDRIAELEQERINQEAEFEAQRQADREAQIARDAQLRTDLQADFQEDLDERKAEEEREEYLKAFTAPGRTRTTTTPDDPADIRYFYDIAGDDIFANQQQGEFYGAASPFGDNFMNEILTPPRRKAKGGIIDETDELLKILGE